MVNAARLLSVTGLWLALLRRWLGLWTIAKPPARFVRGLEKTERELAQAIRATLIEDGVAFPALSDAGLLAWFARNHPCSDKPAQPAPAARQNIGPPARAHANTSAALDRRRPASCVAGAALADRKPAVHHARAPP